MRLWAPIYTVCFDAAVRVSATLQDVFSTGYSTGLESTFDFSPLGSLDTLSSEEFTTVRHPLVPDYGMRVKKSKEFCDGTVK